MRIGIFSSYISCVSVSPTPLLLCLSACLLYSRLVLNLQKFIRYKLLLPSYSFIAPHRTESSFLLCALLFLPPRCRFYDSRRRLLLPAGTHPLPHPIPQHPFLLVFFFLSSPLLYARELQQTPPPGACSTSCSSRAVCFRVRK